MATTRKSQTGRKAKRGTLRNPARGVVDLRHATPPRPTARNPYYATWYDQVTKRKGGSKPFATLPEAVQWIEAQERDNLAAYHRGEPLRSTSRKFGDVVAPWAATLSKAHNTVRGYRVQARRLVAHFGHDTPIGGITKHDVQALIHDMRTQRRTNGTIKGRLNVLNQIMEYAVDSGLRPSNPCRGVDRPQLHQRDAYIFTTDEIASILKNLPEDLHMPVLLSLHGGLRIGEVCGLRARALDLVTGMVRIVHVRHADGTVQNHAKGGHVGQASDLPDAILPRLRELAKKYPPMPDGTMFSFTARDGSVKPLSQDRLRRAFLKACIAAGLPGNEIKYHDLRHTCATNYARSDAPGYVIQAQLRHSQLSTSQRYISEVQDHQRRSWANRVAGDAKPDGPQQPPAAA